MYIIAIAGRLGLDDVRPRGCMRVKRENAIFFLVLHNIDALPLDIYS
jgi:hypothetical protein